VLPAANSSLSSVVQEWVTCFLVMGSCGGKADPQIHLAEQLPRHNEGDTRVTVVSLSGEIVATLQISDKTTAADFKQRVGRQVARAPHSFTLLLGGAEVIESERAPFLRRCGFDKTGGEALEIMFVAGSEPSIGDIVYLRGILREGTQSYVHVLDDENVIMAPRRMKAPTPVKIVRGIAKKNDRAHDRGWSGDTDDFPSVSFKLADGRYLRHCGGYIRAQTGSGALFRLDATFRQCPELVSAGTISYQSVNSPDRYLGRDREIWAGTFSGPKFNIAPIRDAVGFSVVHVE